MPKLLNRKPREFRESSPNVKNERVDEENCILYGVRVLGLESDNGRVYLKEAVAKAIGQGLYEGKSVRMNHPDPESKADKPVESVNGWLENVRATDDGARGDWHLNPKHDMTPAIMWAAKNRPDQYGLSHNIGAVGEPRDGKFVITEIVSVASIDLVSDPATVRGLFESRSTPVIKKIKRRTLLEGLRSKLIKWRPQLPKTIRGLCEAMDDAMGDSEMVTEDESEEPAKLGPDDHLKKGIYEACHSLIESDEHSADEKSSKIAELLRAHEKLVKPKKAENAEGDVDIEGTGPEDNERPTEESRKLQARVKLLEDEKTCRKLCESLNFNPSETFLEALVSLPADKRTALVKEAVKSSGSGKPRSGNTQESYRPQGGNDNNAVIDTSKIVSTEGFTAALRGARN